jgi:spore germination protein YaaH
MARNVGRYMAPIALVAVIVATVLVIRAGLDTTPHTAVAHTVDSAVLNVHAPPRRRFYVIRPGDTLSTISVKTGVSVPTLENLNPSVDPNALQTGQRLRLRP